MGASVAPRAAPQGGPAGLKDKGQGPDPSGAHPVKEERRCSWNYWP